MPDPILPPSEEPAVYAERVRQIVRQFPENGMKQVLLSPNTLRELLTLGKTSVLPRIEFAGMEIDPTTFVTAEYRHVSSDLVLTVTLRPTKKRGRKKRLTLTILIELQAEPDRLMMLRVLDYLVQIWKRQVKRHGEKHGSLASVKLTPVLPVVFHTGSYSWEKLGKLLDLMDDAEGFNEVTPAFKPVFISLPDLPESVLERDGGYFGQVLALVKARKAGKGRFGQRLARTVRKLEELKGPERLRRVELLSYVEGLVYHSREASEHESLRESIDAALRGEEAKLEVNMVRKSMADVDRERWQREGVVAANKRTLLEQLRLRWGDVPAEMEETIEGTQDPDQLMEWLRRFATARDLDSLGIVAARQRSRPRAEQ